MGPSYKWMRIKVMMTLKQVRINELNFAINSLKEEIKKPLKQLAGNDADMIKRDLKACIKGLYDELEDALNVNELYYYSAKQSIVCTPNLEYAKLKVKKFMQRNHILGYVPKDQLVRKRWQRK
jgi:hypothetical protein